MVYHTTIQYSTSVCIFNNRHSTLKFKYLQITHALTELQAVILEIKMRRSENVKTKPSNVKRIVMLNESSRKWTICVHRPS